MSHRIALVLALAIGVSLVAHAQGSSPPASPTDLSTLSLEQLMNVEVVHAASRFEQSTREAPATVTVVTAAEIRQFGWRTLDEILRSVRGIYVTSDRSYSYVGIRGLSRPGDYNSRLLVLVDGHRLNENVYESVQVEGGFPLDVDLIDRIEVVRGPGSSLYGANAFFGVVNVITRPPRDVRTVEASAYAASFGTFGGRLTAGGAVPDGPEGMVSGSIQSSKGQTLTFPEFDSPQTKGGIAEGADGERFSTLFGKASWKGVTLEGAWVSREKTVPTAYFSTIFGDPRTRTVDGGWYLDLSTARDLGGGWDLSARASYQRSSTDGDYVYAEAPDVVNRDFARGISWGGEAVAGYSGFAGHRLLAGAEFQDNVLQAFGNYDLSPYAGYLDVRGSSTRWAAFAQDEWRLSRVLLLSLGARWDHYSTFGGRASPRVGAVLMPDAATTVKLVFGTAFRAPSAYERLYDLPPTGQKANLDLRPETIQSGELAFERLLGENVQVRVMGFAYRVDGLVSLVVDPADGMLQYQNTDRVDGAGVEASIVGRWPWAMASLSLTSQDVRNAATDAWLTNSPRTLAKLHVTVPIYGERLSAGLETLFTGRRLTLGGEILPGFLLTNLTLLSTSLLPGLSVSATVTNLFDRKYSEPASAEHLQDAITQDGRAFRLHAVIRF